MATTRLLRCMVPLWPSIGCLMAPMATYRFLQGRCTLATKYLWKCIRPPWKSIGCLMALMATYRFSIWSHINWHKISLESSAFMGAHPNVSCMPEWTLGPKAKNLGSKQVSFFDFFPTGFRVCFLNKVHLRPDRTLSYVYIYIYVYVYVYP